MIGYFLDSAAILLAVVINLRVICVLHQTTPKKHRHVVRFLGFGYSYVALGGGAIFGAIGLTSDAGVSHLALWLLLAGSCGLIVFDRRAAICITSGTECPLENRRPR